jgi:hypothetical protein
MKKRSLFGLMVSLAVLGVGSLTRLQPATSAPAPSFRPILRDIQNQLPRGMVMRLPASLELIDFQGKKITIYPILEPYRRGEFRISLNTTPNCQAHFCQFGYIAAFQQNSKNYHLGLRSRGVPITLGEKVSGVYVYVDIRGASTTPYGLVTWEQNNLSYLVSLPFSPGLTLAQNKQLIINIATSMANEPPIYDIATANSQIATGRSQQSTRCVRWSTFSQSLGEMGRGAPYRSFNELPNGFKQGCIFFQDNNSIDVAYVLKDGVEPSAMLTNGKFSYGGAPSFSYEQSKQFDDLTTRGQALMITWLTPTNGSLPYLRSIPKDRAFVRDDGMVCFRTVCLKSSAVLNQQLSQILEAGQIATGRAPSSSQQTTTVRSPSPVQTYRDTRALGMAQFLQGKQRLISAQNKLQLAVQDKYDLVEIPKSDFLEDPFTDVAESPGTFLGKRNNVSYGDYLKLKLKLKAQEKLWNEGIDIVKAIEPYNEKLNKDNRQGGREVSQRISSNFNEYFNRVSEQDKKPSLSLEVIVRALPYAIEEARISDINLITGGFQTGGKLASAFTDLGGLVKLLNLPELTKPESFQRAGRSLDYVVTVQEKLGKIKEEFLKGNQEKINDINLEIASETIKLMDAQDSKSTRTAEAIAIRSEATNLIDRNKFLQQSQLTEVLDGFDKTYLTTAQVASTIKMITSALAFIAPGKQAVRTFADKADAVNALLFNALQFSYKEDVRKQYELLKAYSNRNQQMISGLSSSIDFSAQEVGRYLIKTRTDVVTRRPDGTIAVSINGVVSPP